MEALFNQYGPIAVALLSGAVVKWWNKKRGTHWHQVLSPLVAILAGMGTSMATGTDLSVDSATAGAAAIAIQSLWRGGKMAATGKLGGV